MHSQQVGRQHLIGRNCKFGRGQDSNSERLGQGREMGKQEHHEVHQKHAKAGMELPHATMQTRRQLCRKKDLGVLVGNRLDKRQLYVLAAKKANNVLDCIIQQCGQKLKGGCYSPLLSTGEAHL